MELLEIAAFRKQLQSKKKFCDKSQNKDKDPGWKVVIDGIDGGEGDAKVLADNIPKVSEEKKPKLPPKKSKGWDLDKCNTTKFPWQAHHLIPAKLLPKHDVCFFLAKNSKKSHPKYVLEFDTYYDTNDGLNGRFLPFASTTHQWKDAGTSAAKKKDVCFKMMKKTQRQLHQGPHSHTDYLKGEDPNAESKGYKQAVKDLLGIVYHATLKHIDVCEECKGKKKGKKKNIRPLESSVEHVHQAADIMEGLIVNDKVFVSRRAAIFYATVGY
jgi:hypothetical protein